jgi:hypothetical protein
MAALVTIVISVLHVVSKLKTDGAPSDMVDRQWNDSISSLCSAWACAEYLADTLKNDKKWERIERCAEDIGHQVMSIVKTMMAKPQANKH